MSHIAEAFAALKERKGFIPFITAGDPSLEHTRKLLPALENAGSTIIELGVPFSDPLADGPVIQRASQRALMSGASLARVLELVGEFKGGSNGSFERDASNTPIVLFSYLNPVWQMGLKTFAHGARKAGVDGVLLTDLIPEEAVEIQRIFTGEGLDLIFLVAPTSTEERIAKICGMAGGFIYAVSRTGTTGTRESVSTGVSDLVARIRCYSALPIAVGFGISSRHQVRTVWETADAAVVGSAIVQFIEQQMASGDPSSHEAAVLAQEVEDFVRGLIPRR